MTISEIYEYFMENKDDFKDFVNFIISKFETKKEAAEFLGIDRTVLYSWLKKGYFPRLSVFKRCFDDKFYIIEEYFKMKKQGKGIKKEISEEKQLRTLPQQAVFLEELKPIKSEIESLTEFYKLKEEFIKLARTLIEFLGCSQDKRRRLRNILGEDYDRLFYILRALSSEHAMESLIENSEFRKIIGLP